MVDSEKVFFDGEYLDARTYIKELFHSAAESVILIDPYADAKALDYLSSKREKASVLLVASSRAKLTQEDVRAFNLQYGGLAVSHDDSFHDRFILIDQRVLYHLGASLNYAGRKTFAIARLQDERLIQGVLARITPSKPEC